MATSGTFTFQLDTEEILREAFERCLIDPSVLTANDWVSAIRSLNLLFVDWSVRGINYWAVDRQSFTTTSGTASYTLQAGTLDILNMMIDRSGTETIVNRRSLVDYDLLPNKDDAGRPTEFFLDRQYTPTVSLWPVPDNSTDTIYYWRMTQVEDVTALSEDVDAPYRWTEALCAGLAAKIARKKKPELVADLKIEALEAFDAASGDERERATLRIIPQTVL